MPYLSRDDMYSVMFMVNHITTIWTQQSTQLKYRQRGKYSQNCKTFNDQLPSPDFMGSPPFMFSRYYNIKKT